MKMSVATIIAICGSLALSCGAKGEPSGTVSRPVSAAQATPAFGDSGTTITGGSPGNVTSSDIPVGAFVAAINSGDTPAYLLYVSDDSAIECIRNNAPFAAELIAFDPVNEKTIYAILRDKNVFLTKDLVDPNADPASFRPPAVTRYRLFMTVWRYRRAENKWYCDDFQVLSKQIVEIISRADVQGLIFGKNVGPGVH